MGGWSLNALRVVNCVLFVVRKCHGSGTDHRLYHGCGEPNGEASHQVQLVFPPRAMATGPQTRQRAAGQRYLLSGKTGETGFNQKLVPFS